MLNKKSIKKLKYIDYFNNNEDQEIVNLNKLGHLSENELEEIFQDTEKFLFKNQTKEVIQEEEIENEKEEEGKKNLNIIFIIVIIFIGIFLYIKNSRSSTTTYLNQIQR